MPKKEFNIRNYSKVMFALCTAGGVAVVAANFVQYMVQQQYQSIAYIATYGFVLLVAVGIFCVRNQYDDKFCNTHKLYAVLSGMAAVAMLAVRLLKPELLAGQLKSLFGNAIDVNTLTTFILIVLIGKPILDIVDTMRYVQPAPTHIPSEKDE